MFIGFANFYYQFICKFSRIAILLISMLKTSGIEELPGKNNNIKSNGGAVNGNKMIVKRSDGAGDKNLVLRSGFLTSGAKIAFAQLKKIFIKASILFYFELDLYI